MGEAVDICRAANNPISCGWRTDLGLSTKICPPNSQYSGCASACPYTCFEQPERYSHSFHLTHLSKYNLILLAVTYLLSKIVYAIPVTTKTEITVLKEVNADVMLMVLTYQRVNDNSF